MVDSSMHIRQRPRSANGIHLELIFGIDRVRSGTRGDRRRNLDRRQGSGFYATDDAEVLIQGVYHDPARPAVFPQNGRTLTDDAADAFMAILTNGKIACDGVSHHTDLLKEFPYVGPPHGA
jgi:hypothetical protein